MRWNDELKFGTSKKGWMTGETFLCWIETQFLLELEKRNVKLPVVLFVDGHRSHINLSVSEFCSQNSDYLIYFPPNTTHFMQRADVGFFKPLKDYWRKVSQKWKQANPNMPITIQNITDIFMDAWRSFDTDIVKEAFRASGVFPWDKSMIKSLRYLTKRIELFELYNVSDEYGELDLPTTISSEIRDSSSIGPLLSASQTENENIASSDSQVDSFSSREHPLPISNNSYVGNIILRKIEQHIPEEILHSFQRCLAEKINTKKEIGWDVDGAYKSWYDMRKRIINKYFGEVLIEGTELPYKFRDLPKLQLKPKKISAIQTFLTSEECIHKFKVEKRKREEKSKKRTVNREDSAESSNLSEDDDMEKFEPSRSYQMPSTSGYEQSLTSSALPAPELKTNEKFRSSRESYEQERKGLKEN